MPGSTAAGVITAVASIITALALLAGALPLLIRTVRQLHEVHTIVNQQRTDAANYTRALTAALTAAGVEVPVDQSLPSDPLGAPLAAANASRQDGRHE